jgi:hypothetical protein
VIQSLGTDLRLYPGRIGSVELVGSTTPVTWSRTARGLRVELPEGRLPAGGSVAPSGPDLPVALRIGPAP